MTGPVFSEADLERAFPSKPELTWHEESEVELAQQLVDMLDEIWQPQFQGHTDLGRVLDDCVGLLKAQISHDRGE
jgi:hypothetical protein